MREAVWRLICVLAHVNSGVNVPFQQAWQALNSDDHGFKQTQIAEAAGDSGRTSFGTDFDNAGEQV